MHNHEALNTLSNLLTWNDYSDNDFNFNNSFNPLVMYLEFNKTGLVSELQNTKQKATPKEVLKANEFYTWFQNLGGNLTHFNAENIINSCSNTALKFSSFKANPEDTKKRFNHKFNFNL